jgi:hypothetical protein
MITPLELGLDTFGDDTVDAAGRRHPHARVISDVVAEADGLEERLTALRR